MSAPTSPPSADIINHLAPRGVLRAAINMSNFLLVTGSTPEGDPDGVSPDMARKLARRIGVECVLLPYETPGAVADDGGTGAWDIANIGAEPKRARKIDFTAAYAEIQASYMVRAGSPLTRIDQVDAPSVRIAVAARSAYDLWLERHIKQATLVRAEGIDGSFRLFMRDGLDALAGLRPRLVADVKNVPGATILEGQFTAIQQAIGCNRGNAAAATWLAAFVEEMKATGFVAEAIKKHRLEGRLSVAPPA